jgi:hypothetical protein
MGSVVIASHNKRSMKYAKVSMYLGVIAWALIIVGLLVLGVLLPLSHPETQDTPSNLYNLGFAVEIVGFLVGSIGVVFTLIAVLKRESSKFLFVGILMNGILAIIIVVLAWILFSGGV